MQRLNEDFECSEVLGKAVAASDNYELINHTIMDKCYMKLEPYSYFEGTPKK